MQSTTAEQKAPPPVFCIDSPAIYGGRVETSKPYHLIYIEQTVFCFFPGNIEVLALLYRHSSRLSMT